MIRSCYLIVEKVKFWVNVIFIARISISGFLQVCNHSLEFSITTFSLPTITTHALISTHYRALDKREYLVIIRVFKLNLHKNICCDPHLPENSFAAI